MTGISVTQADLSGLIGSSLTTERYNTVHAATLRLLRTGTRVDIDTATGRTADVLDAVYTSVALRLLTNPTGARSLGLGSANVTFGGTDANISNPGSLTDDERSDLASLGARRPSYVRLRKLNPPVAPDLTDEFTATGDEVLP